MAGPPKTVIKLNPVSRIAVPVIVLVLLSTLSGMGVNFPAGDSWTHGWTVLKWARGSFVFNDWASALALPQQVIGFLVSVNKTEIDWSLLTMLTIFITGLGCLMGSTLHSALTVPKQSVLKPDFLFLAVMVASPFTMKIASGFMTDGYYFFLLTYCLIGLTGIIRFQIKTSNFQWLVSWIFFTVCATLAALQRTHGLLILFFVIVWILGTKIFARKKDDLKTGFEGIRGWIPVILCTLGMIISILVIKNPDISPARSSEVTEELKNFWTGQTISFTGIIKDRLWLIFGILQHFGLALLPITLIARFNVGSKERDSGKKNVNWWYVIIGAVFMFLVLWRWGKGESEGLTPLFPYVGNSITPEGFGPRADTLALTTVHQLDMGLRFLLTVLGTVGGIFLIWIISRTVSLRKIDWGSISTLAGFIGLGHLGLILINPNFFDRYLLPLFPFAFIWLWPLIKDASPKLKISAWVITAALFVFSLVGTIDYLNFTSAKWDIALKARNRGIASNQIICGYEPDGFFNYSNETYPGLDFETRPGMPWWVDRLGLGIEPYYVVIEEGADVRGTVWEKYAPSHIENGRMRVWMSPLTTEGVLMEEDISDR